MFYLLSRISLHASAQVSCSVAISMSSVISYMASNLFLTAQLNSSFSLLTLVCEHCTVVMVYLLSLRTSSLFTRVSRRLLLHFLLMVMWSI